MKTLVLSLLVFLFASFATHAQEQKRDDKQMLIKISQLLEQQPFHEKAKDLRSWAITYLIETKDVSVVVCGGPVMQPLLEKKNKYGSELIAQYSMGMAAFKLSNPDKAADENAAQFAGIESAIKAYQAIVKEKPKGQFAGMDDLAAKLASGELKKMVYEADCAKDSKKN